ncbi:alpha/beta hydrolase [bacterium]|nr:alpha/beta hydrolase [bacterium]
MRVHLALIVFLAFSVTNRGLAQLKPEQDTTINNLVHVTGYKTCKLGELGNVKKHGNGKRSLILIPGLGFDASVFDDFMDANQESFTMYAITIAGFGKTSAPPMPKEGTSYGEQTWNKGTIQGMVELIDKEKLQKPIIVGHFVQGTQLALRLAIDYPEKVGGIIILGGPAKFIAAMGGRVRDFPLDTMILFTDKYTGPKWFKHMKKEFFDDNNFRPEIYSLDSLVGYKLWRQSADVPLPVMVRYSSEYFACDIKAEIEKIKCPVLVLRATFSEKIVRDPINNYVKPQYLDSWDDVSFRNPMFQVKDIRDSGTFIWKDKPELTYKEVENFCNNN